VKALCNYANQDIHLTDEMIDEACSMYFVRQNPVI
jgi:hypothetical protein